VTAPVRLRIHASPHIKGHTLNTITNLNQKKAELISAATTLVEGGLKTPENREAHKKLISQIDDVQDHLDMLSRIERALPGLPVPAPVAPAAATAPESREQRRAKLNSAWRSYLQGRLDDRVQEHRDLLTSVGTAGPLVPQEFSGFLSESLKIYAPLFDYANVRQSQNGRSVKISKVDDRANGLTLLTEGTVTLTEADPSFSSSIVGTDLFSTGAIRFSNQLLSDSAFDLEQLLTRLSASRVGRGIEKLLTVSADVSGTTTPNNPGLINIAQTATTTSTIAAGIGWTDLTNTFDALDAAYLPRSVWQMSSKTRNALASMKDGFGRPYFTPSTDGGFDYLLGRPIVINQSLPSPTGGTFAANAKPIIFGSLFDGLQVVSNEVRVQTLKERYAEFNESAIIVSTRIGSASLQAGALQALRIAAS